MGQDSPDLGRRDRPDRRRSLSGTHEPSHVSSHSRMMGSVSSQAHTTTQSGYGTWRQVRPPPVPLKGASQVQDLSCFHLMDSVSFRLCQVNCLSRIQPCSRFMTPKTPECSRTNGPSILTVGSKVHIQNCFSACRLKIEPAFGGPGTLLCLRDHPPKLTSVGLYMATIGRGAGPDELCEPGGI